MKTRRNRRFVAVLAMATVVLMIWALWPSGPSYRGKSISSWFYHPDKHDAAVFRTLGQAAVPFLIQRLEDAPSERMASLLENLPTAFPDSYLQRKAMWQHRAAYLLGEIGTAAQAAESNLTNAATSANWALRGAATVALMKIRHEPSDPLIEKLRDTSDYQVWYQNAMMVAEFGLQAEPAVPILLDALQHSNNIIQAHALIALGMIGSRPDKCVPAIAAFLSSPDVGQRQKAMGALLGFGTNALPAKKAIENAARDSDPWVRKDAEEAMKMFSLGLAVGDRRK